MILPLTIIVASRCSYLHKDSLQSLNFDMENSLESDYVSSIAGARLNRKKQLNIPPDIQATCKHLKIYLKKKSALAQLLMNIKCNFSYLNDDWLGNIKCVDQQQMKIIIKSVKLVAF